MSTGVFDPSIGVISVDLTQAPNEIPLAESGSHEFEVKKVEVAENKAKDGFNFVVDSEIVSQDSSLGRSVRDYIPISQDPTKNVRLRRFTLASLGKVEKGGVALSTFLGKRYLAVIVQRPDKTTPGKIYANIDDYIIPPDVLAANPVGK